jgi:hypothetical protein
MEKLVFYNKFTHNKSFFLYKYLYLCIILSPGWEEDIGIFWFQSFLVMSLLLSEKKQVKSGVFQLNFGYTYISQF